MIVFEVSCFVIILYSFQADNSMIEGKACITARVYPPTSVHNKADPKEEHFHVGIISQFVCLNKVAIYQVTSHELRKY